MQQKDCDAIHLTKSLNTILLCSKKIQLSFPLERKTKCVFYFIYFFQCTAPCRVPTGACWTLRVLIQSQLVVLMDEPPLSSFLPFSPFYLSTQPETRAADRGGTRRGQTKERGVIWGTETDWFSKSLAPACCRRQPAKGRFLCTFTTVNGTSNQSYIEMVISSTDTYKPHRSTREHRLQRARII